MILKGNTLFFRRRHSLRGPNPVGLAPAPTVKGGRAARAASIPPRWTARGLWLAALATVGVAATWALAGAAAAQTSPDIRIVADDYTPANGRDVTISIVLIDDDLSPTRAEADIPIEFTIHGEINSDHFPSRFEFEVDGAAPPSIPGGRYGVVVPAGSTSVKFTVKVTVSDIGEDDLVEAIIGAWHDPVPSDIGGLTPLGQGVLVVTPDDDADRPTTQNPPPDAPDEPPATTPTNPEPPDDADRPATQNPPPDAPEIGDQPTPADLPPSGPGDPGDTGHNIPTVQTSGPQVPAAQTSPIGARAIVDNLPSVWAERLFPERRFMSADAESGRWLRSSPVRLARWNGADAPFPESSLRIAARLHADGRVEFGLEQRHRDGTWRHRSLPGRRVIPADAEVDRWYSGSTQTVHVAADDVRVRIGARRLDDGRTEFAIQQSVPRPRIEGRGETRVAARRLDDGRTQFALRQRLQTGAWSGRALPGWRNLITDTDSGLVLAGSPVALRIAGTTDADPADLVARVSARTLGGGQVEFAVEQFRRDGTWDEHLLPTWTFIPPLGSTDWLVGPAVALDSTEPVEDTDLPADRP